MSPTRTTDPDPVPEGLAGTEAQRARRQRILDTATSLASQGGFEKVQMRAVAEQADVALGTLYRYFPSKIHLLVSALARELERTQDRIDRAILHGNTPYDRVMVILGGITRAMQRDPLLTEAMTRAVMFADASAAAEVDTVSRLTDGMLARAMSNREPGADQLAIARVISDVWLSNMVAWVTRRATANDVAERLELTVGLLLGKRRAAAH